MQNRRKFLLQTTLAAGSVVLLKPLKTLAFSPSIPPPAAEKLTILHLNTLQNNFQKILGPSRLDMLTRLTSKKHNNTLLLSTGNIMGSKGASTTTDIEKLTWLRKAGCEAIVPNFADLEKGIPYYEELTTECKLTSLASQANQFTHNTLPYHIAFKGNIKIGIIGNEVRPSLAGKFDATKIAFRLNETAAFLKTTHGCHLIISMNPCNTSICNKNQEKELAALTTDVDVIVSSNNLHKNPVTFVMKNASRNEVVLNYQGVESSRVKGIDISFNSQHEKTHFALRRVV